MKKIGIGYERFKDFVENDMYYVDKTMLVRDIVRDGGKVTLFTRPRRFGKTLAISMVQTFFEREIGSDGSVIDNSRCFEGMKIMDAGDDVLSKMGQYPVIKISLKSAKQPDFETAFLKIRDEIVSEYVRHNYILKSEDVSDDLKNRYIEIERGDIEWNNRVNTFRSEEERKAEFRKEVGKYATSIKSLSEQLRTYHNKNVIVLIDEYDVPLENAYYAGFYDEMVGFIRSLFESALKTNDALEFGVVTGCLRISKESIFTGLNNLKVNSVLSGDFSEGFGFTDAEVKDMLTAYGIPEKMDAVRKWYDGYLFGNTEIYNPWSVICYVDSVINGHAEFPMPFWSNTSSNSIIKQMVENADESIRIELDDLIRGDTIEKRVQEDITYGDVDKSKDNLWNFLFFTGYLKKVSMRQDGRQIYLTMKIPNEEICSIYENKIRDWFDEKVEKTDFSSLYAAIKKKDTEVIAGVIRKLLSESISFYDSDESFYHGFFLSLLYQMPDYTVRSNREVGNGRPDVVLYPNHPEDPAYIFEIKRRKKFNEMKDGLNEALSQIADKRYEEGIIEEGYLGAVSFGICFCKKSCIVGCYTLDNDISV